MPGRCQKNSSSSTRRNLMESRELQSCCTSRHKLRPRIGQEDDYCRNAWVACPLSTARLDLCSARSVPQQRDRLATVVESLSSAPGKFCCPTVPLGGRGRRAAGSSCHNERSLFAVCATPIGVDRERGTCTRHAGSCSFLQPGAERARGTLQQNQHRRSRPSSLTDSSALPRPLACFTFEVTHASRLGPDYGGRWWHRGWADGPPSRPGILSTARSCCSECRSCRRTLEVESSSLHEAIIYWYGQLKLHFLSSFPLLWQHISWTLSL